MDKRLEEIIKDPDGFINRSKNSEKLAIVTRVAREANLDDIKLSCGSFLSILGESLDLGLSGIYLFEGRKRLTEFKPGEGVTYNTSEGLEENLIGAIEPQLDHRDGMDMLTMPIIRGDEYMGLAIFRKDEISACDIAVIASSMDITNININKSVRLNRWTREANKDALTGIGNRRFLKYKGNEIADKCRKMDKPYSVLFIDADDFSKVNSRYGHSGGDAVLKEIAKRVKANVRPEDCVARYGGEEFVVILPYTGLKDALAAAQNLRQAITVADPLNDGSSFTVSVGVAENRPDESLDDTIQSANRNMYKVKKTLKNATWIPEEKDEQTGLLGVSPLYSSIKRRIGDCNKSLHEGDNGKVALIMFNIRGYTKVRRSKGETYAKDLLNVVVNSLNGDGPMLDYLDYVTEGPRLARFCDTDRLMGFRYSTKKIGIITAEVRHFMEKILDKVNGSRIKMGDELLSIEVAGSCCIYDPSRLDEKEREAVYENPEILLNAIGQVEGKDNTNFSVGLYIPASAQPSRDFVDPQQDHPSQ